MQQWLPDRLKTSKASQRVLLPDEWPKLTVTSLPDDIVHFSEDRIPTVREVARLQTFPDWFEFKGVRTTGAERRRAGIYVPHYTQVANAVPPRLAHAVASRVRWFLELAAGQPDCDFELPGPERSSNVKRRGTTIELLDDLNQHFHGASARLVRCKPRTNTRQGTASAPGTARLAMEGTKVQDRPVEPAGALG
jgi:hypothetical protein